MDKEIDRPLGQNRIRKEPRRRKPVRWKGLFSAVCVIGIFGISGMIALRDRPFRQPVESKEAEAAKIVPAKTEKQQPTGVARAGKTETPGPAIIHVNPQSADNNDVVIIRDPSALSQNPRFAHVPDPALLEDSPYGRLPTRSADGKRPFDVYARPWSGSRGAKVAIVIGGLGLSQTGTQSAIAKLPPAVTLAFAPLGNSLNRWMVDARNDGHEIVMQVPLEPYDYPNINPGRNTLTVDAGTDENLKNLRWVLGRTTNYTGVMNYMGARFLGDDTAMEPFMKELYDRGLMFLDDGTSARSVAAQLSKADRVPFAEGDAVIDTDQSPSEILKKLDNLERTARARGFAIGTGSAFDTTVDAVTSWVTEAQKRGTEIVPISALADDPEAR
jgi:polysaccharide deacetylase 2 family uncharacterized protein YibQ